MPAPRAHRVRLAAIAILATVAALTAVLGPGSPAQAKPSASDVKKQISDLNNQIETVVEDYNGVHTKLAKDTARVKALRAKLPQADLAAALAQGRVGPIAYDVYVAGPASGLSALLDTDNTSTLLDELAALNSIARSQRTTIDTATAAVANYQSQVDALNTLIASETTQDKQLASKKADILVQLAKLKVLQAQIATATTADNGGGGGGGGSSNTGCGGCSKYSRAYVEPHPCPLSGGSGPGYAAAKKACSLLWPIHMYGWAQAGPSRYDCSGLTMTAWTAGGKSLAHFTGDQWGESHAISRSSLRPGDLVFYNGRHHVAIYVGDGWIVQAEETGEPIKESPVNFESVVSSGYRRVNGT